MRHMCSLRAPTATITLLFSVSLVHVCGLVQRVASPTSHWLWPATHTSWTSNWAPTRWWRRPQTTAAWAGRPHGQQYWPRRDKPWHDLKPPTP